MFYLASTGRGDVLTTGNLSKERDTLQGKCKIIEKKCFTFQKEMTELKKKFTLADSQQEEEKTYDFPSTMTVQISQLEMTLEAGKKQSKKASDAIR